MARCVDATYPVGFAYPQSWVIRKITTELERMEATIFRANIINPEWILNILDVST